MRAHEITDAAVEAIVGGAYDVIVMNYANADMVGHTGKWEPTIAARRDARRLPRSGLPTRRSRAGRSTRDHRRSRQCRREDRRRGQSAHGAYDQSRSVRARRERPSRDARRRRKLGDVAPTLLRSMGLPIPEEMNGIDLLRT